MSDRSSSKGDATRVGAGTKTVTRIAAAEEKVLRMRHGWMAPDTLKLEPVAGDDPELAARLREIELKAYRKSGRLDELRRDVGLEERPESDVETREKIIERLRALGGDDEDVP